MLIVTAVHANRPTLTYRILELGGSTLDIGLIQAANSILPTVLAVPIGRVVDRTGERSYLAIAMAVTTLACLIATYAGSLLWLGISQLVLGLGQIGFLVAGQSLVANYGPRDGRDARFGHYATAHSLGQLVGPALAGLVLSGAVLGVASLSPPAPGGAGSGASGPLDAVIPDTQIGVAFLVTALLAGGALIAALMLPRPRRRGGAASAESQPGTLAMAGQVLQRPGMAAAMAVSIIVAASVDMVIAYLPVYGELVGLPVAFVGLLLTIRGIAALVSRLFISQLINLLTRKRTLALSMVLSGLGLIFVPFFTADWVLVLLMVAAGLGLGLGQPMTIAWVATRSPRSERATALGVRLTGNRASLLVVPPLLGALAGAAGVTAIFVILAAALLGGALLASRTPFDELVERRPAADPAPEPVSPA
jgi:MFS family permease